MRILKTAFLALIVVSCALTLSAQTETKSKPKLTLDDFFNGVSFGGVELSPDGNSVVIVTERADWDQQIFRSDIWHRRELAHATDPVRPRGAAPVVARRSLDRISL